jgi:omega-6 fatty acid desaturase (delta-12 desaturase)
VGSATIAVRSLTARTASPALLAGSIGFHHIHHLASRIPNYRLRACFAENLELRQGVKRVTLWGSIKAARPALWDESAQRLVSFRQAARAA